MSGDHQHLRRAAAIDMPDLPQFRADPSCSRQLRERGPLMFWRPSPDDGKEGLLCMLDICANPGCNCREVQAHLVLIDDQLIGVDADDVSFSTVWWPKRGQRPANRQAVTRIDIDSSSVKPDGKKVDKDLVEWLRSEMDEELCALLQRRWSARKERERPRPQVANKVGRNGACPCGSGRKHKHCCGAAPTQGALSGLPQ